MLAVNKFTPIAAIQKTFSLKNTNTAKPAFGNFDGGDTFEISTPKASTQILDEAAALEDKGKLAEAEKAYSTVFDKPVSNEDDVNTMFDAGMGLSRVQQNQGIKDGKITNPQKVNASYQTLDSLSSKLLSFLQENHKECSDDTIGNLCEKMQKTITAATHLTDKYILPAKKANLMKEKEIIC